jgi:hypothetical protein
LFLHSHQPRKEVILISDMSNAFYYLKHKQICSTE